MPDNFITPKTRKEYFAAKIGGLVSDEGPVMPMVSIGKDYFFNNVESDWQIYSTPGWTFRKAAIWMNEFKRAEFLEKVNNDPDNATVIVDGHYATFWSELSNISGDNFAWTIQDHIDNGRQNGFDFIVFTDARYDKAIATIDVYTEDFIEVSPKTPIEKYLAKIAGNDVELPTPKTAMEYALNAIAENGGSGGDVYDAVEIINVDSIPWVKESGATNWTASIELDADLMGNMHATPGAIMISEYGLLKPMAYIATISQINSLVIYNYTTSSFGQPSITTTIEQVSEEEGRDGPVHWYVKFEQTPGPDPSVAPTEQNFVCKKLVKRT